MKFFDSLFRKNGSPEYDLLVRQSEEELSLRTAAHDGTWHLCDAAWSVDQDAGIIVFTRKDGVTATAPVQIVGTYNIEDSTWLWGWDHPSVLPALRVHAAIVRDYGAARGITRLTTRKFESSEEEAWRFTAIACKLAGAQGAYRGPADPARVFMTFGSITLSPPKDRPNQTAHPTTL